MTVGMHTYHRIKVNEDKANNLGFKFKPDFYGSQTKDKFVLLTDEHSLPAYRAGAQVFSGNLDELESFLHGIEWARDYDHLLGLKTGQRRERVEKRLRNQQLVKTIQESGNNNEEDEEDFPF
jgi:hypothetical protein